MGQSHRFAILGDFHLYPDHTEWTVNTMEDIRAANPDQVIALGDFGTHMEIGTPAGLNDAWNHLSKIGAPIRPILGNHDLQEESRGRLAPHTMEKALCELAGLDRSFGKQEFDAYRIWYVTTEYQSPDTCWTEQECYVSDGQFAELTGWIRERPGVPIIIISHAPPLGCGLKTHPQTHVRCTNAYLDQNHDLFRWMRLYQETPEIVLWFSAHYHLGHHHPNSHTERSGAHFFNVQVHGLGTRDGTRESRILDISESGVTISSLDHIGRGIRAADWTFQGGLSELVRLRREALSDKKQPDWDFDLGEGELTKLYALSERRVLIQTNQDYLWEGDLESGSILGTYHLECPLDFVAVSGNWVWRAWGERLALSDATSLERFIRERHANPEDMAGWTLPDRIIQLEPFDADHVLALTPSALWKISRENPEPVCMFKSGDALTGISKAGPSWLAYTACGKVREAMGALFCSK